MRGDVLEVMDSRYSDRFGLGVTRRDVLDVDPANPRATIVADLARADDVPSDRFDCFILTQTLQFIYDVDAAVEHAHRIVKPGGTVLATVPSASRVSRNRVDREYWRFTAASCGRLFARFGPDVEIESHGNVLACVGFLEGVAAEELRPGELDAADAHFPLVIAVRATKPAAAPTAP